MAMSADPAIPDRIRNWIESEGGDCAIVLATVDARARPHPAMLARDEVTVLSATSLRVAVGETSETGENLRLRSSATLMIYDADLACVLKTSVTAGPSELSPGSVAYDLKVEDVRFDAPPAEEGSAHLVTGLRFEGRPERAAVREGLKKSRP